MKKSQSVSLSEICEFQGGNQPPKSNFIDSPQDGYIRLLQIRDFSSDKNAIYVPDNKKLRKVKSDDILLGRYGGSVGKVLTGKSGAYNVAMIKFVPDESRVIKNFIFYVLNTKQFQSFIKKVGESRAAQDGFNKNDLSRFFFPLPDLDEQYKIVSRLNKIQILVDKRIETIKLIDVYIQSKFLEMFHKNSNDWEYEPLKNSGGIKSRIQGVGRKSGPDNEGKPMLRMNNLTYKGEIFLDSLKWITLSTKENESFQLKDRNVLFNRTNSPELVGKMAVWDKGEGYTFAGYLVKLELNEEVLNPYYLTSYFNSDFGKKVLKNKARLSGSLANLSGSKLLEQLIPIPPIELQNKYEKIYIKVQKQKLKYQQQLEILNTLFQAFLQSTFSEGAHINEDEIFESLLQNYTIEDLKKGDRLVYLLNWIDKNKMQFSSFEQYDNAWNKLRGLLEDGSIEQFIDNDEIKLRVAQ